MTDNQTIRRRPDGSIDTAFYMARGRQARSSAAATMARRIAGEPLPRPKRRAGLITSLFAVPRPATR